MSIVTDALNRVQAERARPSGSPDSIIESESSSAPPSPASSKTNLFTPQPPSKTIRNILRWSLLIVGVAAVGIGAYLWGLTLMPDVARVSPEHDVIPEKMSELPLEEQVPAQNAEELPVPTSEEKSSEVIVSSSGDATDLETVKAEPSPDVAPNAHAGDSQKPRQKQVASLEVTLPHDSEKLPAPVTSPNPTPQTKKPSQDVETVSSETSQPEPPALTPKSEAKPPTRSNPPNVRHSSPTEATLIQAKYLIKKRRYQHAVILLKPLFVTPPETWEPWFWLGTAQLGLEQFEQAEESFLEGLARNAAIPHLWVQRALVSQQRGLYGEAVEALRHAELIAPDLPEVQLNLAFSLEGQGRITDAVHHYQAFLAITEGSKSYQPARKKVLDRIVRLEKT